MVVGEPCRLELVEEELVRGAELEAKMFVEHLDDPREMFPIFLGLLALAGVNRGELTDAMARRNLLRLARLLEAQVGQLHV